MDNFLPNCNWQLNSNTWFLPKKPSVCQGSATGQQPIINCASFQTLNNAPTFFTADTGELKVGDLVIINGGGWWGYAPAFGRSPLTAVRVLQVTPGTSFMAGPCPLGGVSPAVSFPCTAQAICPGNGGTYFRGPDGWSKTQTLVHWVDDFAINSCPGALRTLGLRVWDALDQVWWQCPQAQLKRYTGRPITFGVMVAQRGVPSAGWVGGNWRPWIYDNIKGYTYATTTPVCVANGFEFLSITVTPTIGASDMRIGMDFTGTPGDVFYVALPTAGFASAMSPGDCGQNSSEMIRSVVHWNPPLLTPLQMEFPPAQIIPGSGLYGFNGQDLEAMSLGMCHNSVAAVKCKIEMNSPPNVIFLTASEWGNTTVFGPEAMSASVADGAWLPLTQDGTFAMAVNQPNVSLSVTFDFDSVQLAAPSLSIVDN